MHGGIFQGDQPQKRVTVYGEAPVVGFHVLVAQHLDFSKFEDLLLWFDTFNRMQSTHGLDILRRNLAVHQRSPHAAQDSVNTFLGGMETVVVLG